MKPEEVYPLKVGDKVVPMKGKDWKRATHGKPIAQAD
jgi:hypothetical protein